MKILALEASGQTAGCALICDGVLLGEYNIQYKKTHSQTLVPMMEELRKMTELDLATLDAAAVTNGPGSFTGLRIGAATIKGLCLALEIPVIPVSTLESIAWNLAGASSLICPVMDARRRQVYTALYRMKEKTEFVMYPCAMAADDLFDALNARGEEVIFTGDGVPVLQDAMKEKLTVPFLTAPAHMAVQRAGTLASLAYRKYEEQGEKCLVSADSLRLEYLRASQAEQQREIARKAGMMDALAAGTLLKELK